MGTKNQPGAFDCYASAEPDEPMFVLLARDNSAPILVRSWVAMRCKNDAKAQEAIRCAEAMERWWHRRNPSVEQIDAYLEAVGSDPRMLAQKVLKAEARIAELLTTLVPRTPPGR